jgi:hypothetical protein
MSDDLVGAEAGLGGECHSATILASYGWWRESLWVVALGASDSNKRYYSRGRRDLALFLKLSRIIPSCLLEAENESRGLPGGSPLIILAVPRGQSRAAQS